MSAIYHAPGGCGANVRPPYENRPEDELLDEAPSLACQDCLSEIEATYGSRPERSWYRHAVAESTRREDYEEQAERDFPEERVD